MTTIIEPAVEDAVASTANKCCAEVDWAAAPLVDALPEFVQAGKADWRDMTLAQAWQLGWTRR